MGKRIATEGGSRDSEARSMAVELRGGFRGFATVKGEEDGFAAKEPRHYTRTMVRMAIGHHREEDGRTRRKQRAQGGSRGGEARRVAAKLRGYFDGFAVVKGEEDGVRWRTVEGLSTRWPWLWREEPGGGGGGHGEAAAALIPF